MIMLAYPNISALVEGHTDNVGDDEENMTLSKDRANAVLAYLVERKVDAGRISAEGYGETQPIKSNKTEEGRAANRRCVVKPYIKK
jgi:outer membrane protein OmpA-like peptidoglycan-associated protein